MKSKSLFLVSLVVGAIMLQVFFVGEVFALAIPKYLSYEGYLTDSDDTALTGTYNMTFKLYDALTDGNLEWTEVQSGVTVTNGYFAVQLGDTTALTLAFDEQYFLTITVGSDSEMTPRQPVNAVGYSYASDVAFGSFGASTAPTSPSGGDLYYDTDDGNLYVYDDVLTAWTDMTGGGGGTLQTAYDAGVTIEQDASGPVLITETDDDNTDLLQVTANASTGNVFTADLIQMTMDAVDANGLTGNGLHIVVDVSQNTGYLILAEDDVGADIFYVDETGAILAAGVFTSSSSFDITPGTNVDAIDIIGTNMTSGSSIDMDLENTSGNVIDMAWTTASQADAVLAGISLDFTTLTPDDDKGLYGLHINDAAWAGAGSLEYAIYQQGTNWDYGLYLEDDAFLASGKQLRFADTGEYISGGGTDLTIASGGDIGLTATADVNLPNNVGLVFGDDGEKIEGNGTDLTIASSNLLNLTATSDVVIPVNVGLHFGDGAEKIESNNTDLTINSGGDIDLVPVSDVDVTLPAGGKFFIDAATTDNTGTAGVLDINYDAAASGGSGISLALTAIDDDAVDTLYGIDVAVTVQADTTADDVVYGQRIDLNNQDTAAVGTGLYVTASDSGLGVVNSGITIANLQATDIDMTDGLVITAATDGSMPDAIDVSDAEITNAINVGDNVILGAAGAIDLSYFDVAATTGAVTLTQQAVGVVPLLITAIDNATAAAIDIDAHSLSGSVIDIDWVAETQTGAISAVDVDLTNLTSNNSNNLYGIHLNDFTSGGAGGNLYGIYQEGTAWDYGLFLEDDAWLASGKQLQFADAGENISGDGTNLTIASSALLNLTATSDVVIPVNVGLHFGDGAEKIESNNTDLTINSGGDIDLVPVSDVDVTLPAGGKFFIDAATTDNTGTAGVLDINVDAAADNVVGQDINIVSKGDYNYVVGQGITLASGGMTTPNDVNIAQYITLADHASDAAGTSIYGNLISNSASNSANVNWIFNAVYANTAYGFADLTTTQNSYGYQANLVSTGAGASTYGLQVAVEQKTNAGGNLRGVDVAVAPNIAGTSSVYGGVFDNAGSQQGDAALNVTTTGAGGWSNALLMESGTIAFNDYDGQMYVLRGSSGNGYNMSIHAADGNTSGTGGNLILYGGAGVGAADGYVKIGQGAGTPTQTLTDDDLYVKGQVEIDGAAYFDGALQMGSSTVDTGAFTMIRGGQTGDPQVQFALSADANGDFSITPDTGDIDLVPASDVDVTLVATGKVLIDGSTTRTGTNEVLDIDATIDTTTATDDVIIATIAGSRAAADTGGTIGWDVDITTGNMANGEWSKVYEGAYNTSAAATATSNAAVFYAGTSTVGAQVNDYGIYISSGYDVAGYFNGASLFDVLTADNVLIKGGNGDAARTLLVLGNDDEQATTEVAQTAEMEFDFKGTSDGGSSYASAEAASIVAYKVSDWFNASGTADNDSGLKFYTTDAGTPTLALTIDNSQDATFAGDVAITGALSGITTLALTQGMTFAPTVTGTLLDFDLDTEWQSGTLLSAQFNNSTTQTGDYFGMVLNFNGNLPGVADKDVIGYQMSTPVLTQSTTATTNYMGWQLLTAGALVQDTAAGTINWKGMDINMPATTQTTGTVTAYGLNITGGAVTSGTVAGVNVTGGAVVSGAAGAAEWSGMLITMPAITNGGGGATAVGLEIEGGSITSGLEQLIFGNITQKVANVPSVMISTTMTGNVALVSGITSAITSSSALPPSHNDSKIMFAYNATITDHADDTSMLFNAYNAMDVTHNEATNMMRGLHIGTGYDTAIMADSGAVYFSGLGAAGAGTALVISAGNEVIPLSSSERYKGDIGDLAVDMDAFMALRPVSFKWNEVSSTPGAPDYGLIAEDVEVINPEWVTYNKEGLVNSVYYNKVYVMMLDVVQQHQTKLVGLEANLLNDGIEINSDETIPSANILIVKSDVAGDDDPVFRVQADGNVFADGAYSSTGADYAERFYTRDTGLVAGEVVCIDITRENAVKRCSGAADGNVMGIVSGNPSIIGNTNDANIGDPNYVVIGMMGQVKAKVSSENGAVRAGDSLTSASIAGYAMKANAGDPTVGVALGNLSGGTGEIKVLISRRNKSLTVETIEQEVAARIAAMEIEDEVAIMISSAIDGLDLSDDILEIVESEVAVLEAELEARLAELDKTLGDMIVSLIEDAMRVYDPDKVFELETLMTNSFAALDERIAELETEEVAEEVVVEEDLGDFIVETLRVSNLAVVDGRLIVKKHVIFNGDTVGRAKILNGYQEVKVVYAERYEYEPIVMVTLRGDKALSPYFTYAVVDESVGGFTIKLNGRTDKDVEFNWYAFGAQNGKMFVSDGTVEGIVLTNTNNEISNTAPSAVEVVVEETPSVPETGEADFASGEEESGAADEITPENVSGSTTVVEEEVVVEEVVEEEVVVEEVVEEEVVVELVIEEAVVEEEIVVDESVVE